MEVKITYPHIEKQGLWLKILHILKFLFFSAALICPVVNIIIGGKAWSIIVLMILYMVHVLILFPDLVEYNLISQTIKFIILLCILLMLVDIILYSGWATFVTSVITCCGLIISGILFFTNFNNQRNNMFPMFCFICISIVRASVCICLFVEEIRASFILMIILSFILIFLFLITLKKDLMRELICRFNVK